MEKIKYILKGVIGSLVLTFIFIVIFSFILANTDLNDNYIKPVLVGLTFFSIAINSFLSLKKLKSKGLVSGLIIGLIYCMLLIISSSILNKGIVFSVYSYVQIIFCLLSGMLGGILGVNVKV